MATKNLLDLTELTTASALAEVYIVYNDKDYRMTLKTLLTLVTKAAIGLDKVDNTSDLDKPVSTAVSKVLGDKANTTDVVSKVTFEALVQSLEKYVTIEQMNAAIKTITDSLNNYLTKEQASVQITAALTPITETVGALTKIVEGHTDSIASINDKLKTSVLKTTMDEAIAQSKTELTELMGQQAASFNQALSLLSQRLDNFQQAMEGVATALAGKADKDHLHTADSIDGLEAFVKNLIGTATGEVFVGVTDW